ncbi:ABC transporter ATP-binding protein [Kutzneria sp. 744]|uniref:nickel ABC transporter ATP-binding protein NikE n=1 Tax=Kutzneria sp. (strain 744) TaxID=345341 RepID=UPI001E448953|nr:ABC transporter ATP-binding protein [Kutzneria sp. 744]
MSFEIGAGECLALVGESGSGKSLTARSLIGLAGAGASVSARRMEIQGVDLSGLGERGWRRIRGRSIGLVNQDALVALDPLRPVGLEVDEALRAHRTGDRARRRQQVIEALGAAAVPDPELRARQYPHQLSGGLRQRVLVASALAAGPQLVIADEPTTALDPTVQAEVLELLGKVKAGGTAILLISHDLGVVARLADRIAVMHAGTIVEQGATSELLARPRHDHTRALLAAAGAGSRVDPRCGDEVLLDVREVSKRYRAPDGTRMAAVDQVSFQVRAGEVLGMVGESGSGKSTVARIVTGLLPPDSGGVWWDGEPWSAATESARRPRRREIQLIQQDPLSAFDPRFTVAQILGEALGTTDLRGRKVRRDRAVELLELVGLSVAHLRRRPAQLSGGQRQRLAIARALATGPRLIVCDEPVSALDAVVREQVLALLDRLRVDFGMSLLFISHDLRVVRRISHRVLVVRSGRVVEVGATDAVLSTPQSAYTRDLVAAVPELLLP